MKAAYASLIVVTFLAAAASAASPELRDILPRGAQRGTELDVTFTGQRLNDVEEVMFYDAGLSATRVASTQPTKDGADRAVRFHVKVAPDAALGEHAVRLRARSGVSDVHTFWVGALPVVNEKEPNNAFENAQKINLNITLAGVIDNEDTDTFAVDVHHGQRLTAEVEAMRLGGPMFDPVITIFDPEKKKLVSADDTALLRQDCFASVIAQRDGYYYIQVRELTFGGGGDFHYRLHVGTFPRPTAIYPPGGKPSSTVEVKFLGDVTGPIIQTLKLPAEPDEHAAFFAQQGGASAPSPNYIRVNELPSVNEVEPNHDVKSATAATQPAPVAFNGIISKPRETDFFRFTARKDQPLEVNVYARRLRSPLDPVLAIMKADGGQLASNDDAGGPDSYLRFQPPSDSEYVLSVRDQLGNGGVDYVYRVELTRAKDVLVLTVPAVQQNNATQERQAMAIPRGNRFATLIRANRGGIGGELALDFKDLPGGVKVDADTVAQGTDVTPVVFEADARAPIAGKLVDVDAKLADHKPLDSRFEQHIDLVAGQNNQYFHALDVDKLPVAVTEEAPFSIDVVQPKAPMVQGGAMNLHVVAKRQPGFKGVIQLRLLYAPNGVSSGVVDIPADKSEADFALNAGGQAPPKKFRTAILADSDVRGQLWVSSKLFEVELAPPMVTGRIKMTPVEQGKSVKLVCDLDVKRPFDGVAKIQLVNLPPNVTCDAKEITAADKRVEFDVQTSGKSPPGVHNGLFCQLTITQDGEPIVHNIARGTVLRIDAPRGPRPTSRPAQTASK